MTDSGQPTADDRQKAAAAAARSMETTETEAWKSLSPLSEDTRVDAREVIDEEIEFDGASFSGPVIWHVTLSYDQGQIVSSESFPGRFEGKIENEQAVITRMTADTRSYFE